MQHKHTGTKDNAQLMSGENVKNLGQIKEAAAIENNGNGEQV